MSMQALIEKVVVWGDNRADVRAILMIGSRARVETPADEWSDLDALLFVTDYEFFVHNADWPEEIAPVWVTFVEPTIGGGMERRVLFAGGLDVDFAPIPVESVQHMKDHGFPSEIVGICQRGARFLVDKDGFGNAMLDSILNQPPDLSRPPAEHEFLNTVNDFWYHTVWTLKKLRRGELWTAKGCLDSYMKHGLLQKMLEWHARATHGWGYDTWHRGRFLEKWADPRAVEQLQAAFAHYDASDIRRALLATMALYHWLAVETAEKLGYVYPQTAEDHVTQWIQANLGE